METYSHRARSQIENAAEVVGQSDTLKREEEKAENEIDLPSGQKERIAYLKFCCWFLWRKRGGRGRSEEKRIGKKKALEEGQSRVHSSPSQTSAGFPFAVTIDRYQKRAKKQKRMYGYQSSSKAAFHIMYKRKEVNVMSFITSAPIAPGPPTHLQP